MTGGGGGTYAGVLCLLTFLLPQDLYFTVRDGGTSESAKKKEYIIRSLIIIIIYISLSIQWIINLLINNKSLLINTAKFIYIFDYLETVNKIQPK